MQIETFVILRQELSLLEEVSKGAHGIIYKARWKEQIVAYKNMRIANKDDKMEFEKEYNVWQYV